MRTMRQAMNAAAEPAMPPATGESQPDMIRLSDTEPFAVGGRRLCYVHPHEPDKCIKVARQDERRTVRITSKRRLIPGWLRRGYDNNAHEHDVLQRLFARIGPEAAEHLPRDYGYVQTDQGPGLVLDLVRDAPPPDTPGAPGPIARSLRELLSRGEDVQQFRSAFDDLARFLLAHRVVTRALLDHNMAAQHRADGTWRLVLIDGLGDPAWLPWGRWIPPLARRRIRRRIAAAWPRIEAFAASGGVSDEQRAQSSWGQGFLEHRDG